MGTPEFAVPSLEMLIKNHEVCAVVTQPDRPKGRGKKMLFPVIKEKAIEYNIPVLQPEKVKEEEFIEILKKYNADIIVVVAFGQILPEKILNLPKYGCVNVHGSLLPKLRGAAPIQWAVINGEKETGVTTMFMSKGLDCGDMLLKTVMPIDESETYGSLHDRMSIIGAQTLKETLDKISNGTIERTPQDNSEATFAPMITKELGHIDWSKTSKQIINLIRGLNPKPIAYSNYDNETVFKIWNAETVELDSTAMHGEIIEIRKDGFVVKTGDGAINIKEIQATGSKKMEASAYMRGHRIEVGHILK